MTSTAIERTPRIGEMARSEFTDKQIATIKATVAKDANDAELGMFLEVAARYQLDPFTGQVYCMKIPGRDGGGGRIAIVVGRNGILAIANRHPDYKGYTKDTVRENDTFKVIQGGTKTAGVDIGGGRRLVHTYEGTHKQRGEIIAAWCVAYRKGREPGYFYAALEEYEPRTTSDKSPWGKGQKVVMIEKVAISTSHRLAFEITGLYGEEEMARAMEDSTSGPIAPGEIEWPEDEQLAEWIGLLVARANETTPMSWPPAKVKMTLAGKTEGEKEDIAIQLAAFIEERGGTVPERPEQRPEMADDVIDAEAVEIPDEDA